MVSLVWQVVQPIILHTSFFHAGWTKLAGKGEGMPSGQGQGARVALGACAYVYTPFAEPSPCHTQAREAGTRHRVEAMAGRAAAIPRYLNSAEYVQMI